MYKASELREMVQKELLEAGYVTYPEMLFEPINYLIGDGGKRLRPVLLLMAYNLFRDDVEKALKSAVGIEIFHNYTLLHDDVMDDADLRRGMPTVHRKWNNNVAILSGDAAAIVAYQYIESCEDKYLRQVISGFNRMAMEICKGQQLDMEFETRNDVTEEEYIKMIFWKTSVLLGGSLRHGALIAGADEKIYNALYDMGVALGLAFQLQDDYLDVYGDVRTFGKQIGGDITVNKKTYLLIKAMELADPDQLRRLEDWISRKEFDKEEKIKAVTAIYDEIGIRPVVQKAVNKYLDEGRRLLDTIPVPASKKTGFVEIIDAMADRNN